MPGQTYGGFVDAFVRKYDAAGNIIWTRQFARDRQTIPTGVAVDVTGVYVAGWANAGGAGRERAFLRKYDTAGGEQWTRGFASFFLGASDATRAVDADGNVYVAGSVGGDLPGYTSAGLDDAFLRKYDAAGVELWSRQFGTSGTDSIFGIAVDASGLYVVGFTNGVLPNQTSAGGFDAFLRKYDTAGNEIWTRQFGTSSTDQGAGVAVDATGIYVVGNTLGAFAGYSNAGSFDAFVRKYDIGGGEVWTRQFGTAGFDTGAGVALDASGIYVAGGVGDALPGQSSAGSGDAYVRKYDISGAEIWTHQFGTNDSDGVNGIAADTSGIYVTGDTFGTFATQTSAGSRDAFVRKYDAAGNPLWTRQFGSPMFDGSIGVALGESGVYLAGFVGSVLPGQTNAGNGDAFLRKYNAGGFELWTRQFGTAAFDGAFGVAVSDSGLYVAGSTGGAFPGQTSGGGSDIFVAKLVDGGAVNTAPSDLNLALSASVDENGTATLNGSFIDPDAADTHTVIINWGPGEGNTTLNLPAGVTTFSATHPYLDDNPTGTASDLYTIDVTVSDASAGTNGSSNLTVENIAPEATITGPAPDSVYTIGTPITFVGAFTDDGTADTHSAQWTFAGTTIDGSVAQGSGSGSVSDTYIFTAPGVYSVMLTVTDDDGSTGTAALSVTIANAPTSTSLSSSASPAVFGEFVTFTAVVSDAGDGSGIPSGTVQFLVDGTDFGNPVSLSNGTASIGIGGLSTGPHTVTAVYSGDDFFATSTSDGLNQAVEQAATSTTSSVSAATPLFGVDGLTVYAAISVVAPGSGNPVGTVTFYDGEIVLGIVALSDGVASLVLGNTALAAGSHTIRAVFSGDGDFLSSDSTAAVSVLAPSMIQGLAYVDFNNDGQVDFGEKAIAGVTVTLAGFDDLGQAVQQVAQTDANGIYLFANLRPSNGDGYSITAAQPGGYPDGRDTLGTVDAVFTGNDAINDMFSGIVLSQGGSLAENYNFGERAATTGHGVGGQTATIGYWQNRNGQNLILALNGGATATQLGHWLAATFPNLYAELDGKTNAEVAAFYKILFGQTSNAAIAGPPKADAQVLATAFAVYVTNETLAGTTARAYGFQVSETGVGTRTFNVGNNGAAFGVADNSNISVLDLLLAIDARSHNGLLCDEDGDGQLSSSEASNRTMANDVFSRINEAGGV